MRRLLCVAGLGFACREARADDTPEREHSRHDNSVSVQVGVLPNVSFVGLELRHVVHRRIEAALSASYGFAAVAAVLVRAKWELTQTWTVAVGAGPSIAYEKGGPLEASQTYGQVIADAEADVETMDMWLLQLRVGVSAYREDSSFAATPFGGLGIGRAW